MTVCEDIWHPGFPEADEVAAGALLVVNSSASPYHRGKGRAREGMIAERARTNGAVFALCNTVGGQDELVFDGASVVIGADGETLARAAQFEPELLFCDLTLPGGGGKGARIAEPLPSEEAEVYAALTLGLRDYVEKNGFDHVVIALSGGIDSALVALIAVDALGADRVSVVVMPSPNSSDDTQSDARTIAANLGVELIEISIAEAMDAYKDALAQSFEGSEPGIAEENLQARIRGNLVMALSNKFGWLVLTTGNKSELSVGYATLYGDMAGGFAVIKDIFKLLVYRLVRWRNEQEARELVPASVIERPPSRGAPTRPARRGLAPSLRDPGSDPRGLRRTGRGHRRHRRGGPPRGRRDGGRETGRPRRVQTAPGAPRDPRIEQGVRSRPAPADHEPVRLDAPASALAVAAKPEAGSPACGTSGASSLSAPSCTS